MSSNFPIDMEAAKNTKLFKKFMESKNKSVVVSGPKIQNVSINMDPRPQSPPQHQIMAQNKQSSPSFNRKQMQFQDDDFVSQPPKPTNLVRQQQYTKKIDQVSYPQSIQYAKKQQFDNEHQQFGSHRKTQPFVRQKNSIKDDTQYGKKFEKLLSEYNQLKDKVSIERKQYKKEMIKMQQQIDQLNKRIFQLRSREDELILQNKRLKQKSLAQIKQKQQIEEINRQLSYQVQELKDMVDGQENSSKLRQDQASHWRKLNDDLKQKLKQYELDIYKLKDLNNVIEREKFVAEKQASNKQLHLNQMREKINTLITQNGTLRDEMFHITGKLYHFQQQNKSLKADLRRHSDDFPISYLQQQLQQASRHSKSQYVPNQGSNIQKVRMEGPHEGDKKTERRRGQFARERGLKRAQIQNNEQRPNFQQMQQMQQIQQIQQNLVQQKRGNMMQSQSKQISQTVRKLQQLNQELQKLKDMKAMNGSLRRQKINIQRQIQQLQEFLKSRQ